MSALLAERVASEMYYNKLLIQLSDKYNFTPEEVMDLQRNLNQYYIKKDREYDLAKTNWEKRRCLGNCGYYLII